MRSVYLLYISMMAIQVVGQTPSNQKHLRGYVYNELSDPEPYIEVWSHIGDSVIEKTETDKNGFFRLKDYRTQMTKFEVTATGFGYDTVQVNLNKWGGKIHVKPVIIRLNSYGWDPCWSCLRVDPFENQSMIKFNYEELQFQIRRF